MAERSIAWTTNATGDGTSGGYSAANWQNMNLKMFITNPATEGVLYGVGNNLATAGASSPVAVNTGSALVYGIWYENDASVNVTIPTPASSTRVDVIVLRASWAAQTVRITRIAGTEGGGAPALTQTANTTWDIPLANVSITTGGVITLTDRRTWVKHPGVYGWLQQANAWAGNQTVTGTITATSLAVDANFNSALVGGNPQVTFDPGDALYYVRSTNSLATYINNIAVSILGPSGDLTLTGALSASSLNASQLGIGTVPLARLSGITTSQLSASAGIVTGQVADDQIDDTKVGNRVPAVIRRQGGSATDWSSAGTTSYTPAMVRMQAGTFSVPASSSPTAVTFPVAFSQPPVVITTGQGDTNIITISSITASGFSILARERGGNFLGAIACWIAIGTE